MEECVEEYEGREICDLKVGVGKLYAILGDSLEGYYVIKCSSLLQDSFTGKYLKQLPYVMVHVG